MNCLYKLSLIAAFVACHGISAETPNRYMPDMDISKVGNILATTNDPQQLKIFSHYKSDYRYTANVLKAFKESGQSLNTKMKVIKGQIPSVEFRPIERTIFNQMPYANRHPFKVAATSSALGAAAMFGAMKAYDAGYFGKAKEAFERMTAKYIKR